MAFCYSAGLAVVAQLVEEEITAKIARKVATTRRGSRTPGAGP